MISPSIEGISSIPDVVGIPNVDTALPLRTPRVLHRKLKYLIDVDSNVLKTIADKIPKNTCQRYTKRIWSLFFEKLREARRCQLLVEIMMQLKFRPTMKTLGLRTLDDSSEKSIVKNLMSAYESVGSTSHMKDSCAT